MFQPIGTTLAHKQELLEQSAHIIDKVRRAVKGFLKENHPETLRFVTVAYQDDTHTVSIVSSKKSVTSELLLHTKDIRAHLRARHIAIGKIVVLPTPSS